MNVAIEDLVVARGGSVVLDGVDLTAREGRFVGLVGPNGAGKTTLLRTVAGDLAPRRGSVRVGDADVHELAARAASRRVAVVPQDTAVAFDFSVREVVDMGRHPHRPRFGLGGDSDPDAVETALARTDTARFADRSIGAVSGGERKRVFLARALAQDTPVLLLDEPTASLDVNHQIRTLELVRSLVAEGRTAVAAIHDLDLAARYCDELALLADGGVLAAGPPERVLTEDHLRTAFDARTAVARDPVTGSPLVTALPERADAGDDAPRVHVVGGGGAAASLLYPLTAAGLDVSVGVVPAGDRDAETADLLDLDAVTVPPFAPADGAVDRAAALAARADAVVLADVDLHERMAPNLSVVDAGGTAVFVEERPLGERTADPAVRERYETLRARDRTRTATADEVVRAVADAAVDPRPPRLSDGPSVR